MGLLIGILLLVSALFRIPGLSNYPPELFGDELDVGYQAISLFRTGRDVYNRPLPLYLHSFSEWRQGLIVYQLVPTLALFGNTPVAVRLPEAIFGSLTPLILFLLIHHQTKSNTLSFLGALSMAVMPWHVMYSRMAAFGVTSMVDFLLLGLLLYQKKRFFLAFIFFALSLYTYSTALVFVPLFLVVIFITIKSRPKIYHYLFFGLLAAPILFFVISGPAGQRFTVLSFAGQPDFINQIQLLRPQYPFILGKIFNNKPLATLNLFAYNYFRAFSTDFLFVRGDPVVRSSLQVVGQLLPLSAPFLLLGISYLIRRHQWLWLVWLILAPIPSALTFDGAFHASRLFLMVPPLSVALGYGIWEILNWFSGRARLLFSILLIGIFSVHIFGIASYYLYVYPKASWRWWPVGYAKIMSDLKTYAPKYSRVYINNTYEPGLTRFLFWTDYSPDEFHRNFVLDQSIDNISPGYNGFKLGDKYYFGDFPKNINLTDSLAPDNLYLISQRENVPGNWDWSVTPPASVSVLSTVRNPYGDPLFYLITKK